MNRIEDVLQRASRMALGPRTTVQLMILRIDGKEYACIGPVVHDPEQELQIGEVQELHFGAIVPLEVAVALLDGSAAREEGLQ